MRILRFNYIRIVTFFLVNQLPCFAQKADQGSRIIPAPNSMKVFPGSFWFNSGTVILADSPTDKKVAFFREYLMRSLHLKNTCVVNKSTKANTKKNIVVLTQKGADLLPSEGYRLIVRPSVITLIGKDAGFFYGIQSLMQLISDSSGKLGKVPCVTIEDWPRFHYRGLMLDVSRHFFSVEQVKDILDLMVKYKLNRFHWHLTDDQGWRIEIKSFPKLTQVGAWRVPRLGDFGSMLPPQPGEAASDGGYYTQDQIRDIVRYAAERFIEVIPEIDVPGHCMAAIAAYPELCTTKDTSIKVNPGSSFAKWFGEGKFEMYVDNTLNPADENVYDFLDKVFGEVAALFPSPYIHIGGDECYKGYWEKDAGIKAFMKKNDISTSHALQSYFTRKVIEIIHRRHKTPVGWDEIDEGQLDENTVMMSRWPASGNKALKENHKVVFAPGSEGLYFDYAQSYSLQEPVNHGGYAPLWKAYNYNPVAQEMPPVLAKNIEGVQACLWTEHMPTIAKLYYMMLPRLFSLSETAWTLPDNKNYSEFSEQRVPCHLAYLDRLGFNYRVPPAFSSTDTLFVGSHFTFLLQPTVTGAKIYYSLNGHAPTDADREIDSILNVTVPVNKKVELQTIVISSAGRRSLTSKIILYNPKPLEAMTDTAGILPGLQYRLLKGRFTTVDQLLCGETVETGITQTINLSDFKKTKGDFGLAYDGWIRIDTEDVYHFSILSAAGYRLWIDDNLLVDDGKSDTGKEIEGVAALSKGFHKISIRYFTKGANSVLRVFIRQGEKEKKQMADTILFH